MNIYELFSDTDTKVPNGKNSSSGADQADHVGHRQIKRFMHAYQLETFETVGDNSGRIRRGASLRKSDSRDRKDDKATPVGGSQRERRSLLDVAGDREIVTQFEIKRSWVQGECIALCSCNSLTPRPKAVVINISAVAAGSMACLELLVKAGAKANVFAGGATQLLMLEICDGNRPLEVASLRENIKIVETLFMFSLQKQRGKAQKQKQEDKKHSIFPSTLTHKSYLLLKRSLCWLRLGQVEHALSDAKECFIEGAALRLLQRFDKAANAFYERVNQGDH
ncbi:unnamed protein product [Brassica rapa subsp. narinosa]